MTDTVAKGTLIDAVTENGNVAAKGQTDITSPATGIISEIYVKNNDQVDIGTPLFKVHSTATDQDKSQAYASYASAQNATNNAIQSKQSLQSQLEEARAAILKAQNDVNEMNANLSTSQVNPDTKKPYTQEEIDAINSALTSARESFTALETKYNQADTAIAAAQASQNSAAISYQATQDSVVNSPVAGTVANFSASIGDKVTASGVSGGGSSSGSTGNSGSSSSSTSSSSSPVLIIGDFSNLSVKAQVNEVDIMKIKAGDKATISFDALAGKTYVGTVDSVDTVGTNNQGVVTYNVNVIFSYPPSDIKPGMSATVKIQTARKDNALYVPSSAVQTANDQSTVRVLHPDGQVEQVDVETGMKTDTYTEVLSGLHEGDTVVIGTLSTGSRQQSSSPFGGGFGVRNTGFGGGSFGSGAALRSGGFGGGTRGRAQ